MAVKAGRVLDLYARKFQGQPLQLGEYVPSADEKTSSQARIRGHPSLPVRPAHPMLVEHEYERGGALTYLAAWDMHRTKPSVGWSRPAASPSAAWWPRSWSVNPTARRIASSRLLTPADTSSPGDLERRILAFQMAYAEMRSRSSGRSRDPT